MKRQTTIFLGVLLACVAMARPVDHQEARRQAEAFMSGRGLRLAGQARFAPGHGLQRAARGHHAPGGDSQLAGQGGAATEDDALPGGQSGVATGRGSRLAGQEVSAEGHAPLYIFNASGEQGFVIISGDDRAGSVLGYAVSGSYDETLLPDNFRVWLSQAAEEIASLPALAEDESPEEPSPAVLHAAISPLIQTRWDQGSASRSYPNGYLYNTMTPVVSSAHCLTGCVATVGAQLMYYYQHPQSATQPVPGYNWTSGGVLPGLPSTTFRWADMKLTYDASDVGTPAESAVSELMLYAGYAAQMDYGLDGSGANEGVLARAMADLFDYDPSTWRSLSRESYLVAEWDSIIYHELSERRPVIISGQKWSSGGHAFLCDGYDGGGLYHFNWGWGGSFDGWFKLHVTNPYGGSRQFTNGRFDSGYVLSQNAIIGIQPNRGLQPEVSPEDDDVWEEPVAEGIVARLFGTPSMDSSVLNVQLGNSDEDPCGFGFGLAELNPSDGTFSVVDDHYWHYYGTPLSKNQYFKLKFDLSSLSLSEGTHLLVPVCRTADDATWRRCNPLTAFVEASVGPDSTTYTIHPVQQLAISDLRCVTARLKGLTQRISFRVDNLGDNYSGTLYLHASNTPTSRGSVESSIHLKILSGNTKQRTLSFKAYGSGLYYLFVSDDYNGQHVLAQTTVEIGADLSVTSFRLPGLPFAGGLQEVVATVSSSGTDYLLPLYLFVSQSATSTGSAVFCSPSALSADAPSDVTFYFKPQSAGTYYLSVCTDQFGREVVGQTTVNIEDAPAPTTLSVTSSDYHFDSTSATVSATVRNTGETPFYGSLEADLWLFDDTPREDHRLYYAYVGRQLTPEYVIAPGEEQTVSATFSDLLPGRHYMVDWWYSPTYGGSYNTNVPNSRTDITPPLPAAGRFELSCIGTSFAYAAGTAQLTLTVENTGDAAYADALRVELYAWDSSSEQEVLAAAVERFLEEAIAPGSRQTVTATVDDLADGQTYHVRWFHRSASGDAWVELPESLATSVAAPASSAAALGQPCYTLTGTRLRGLPARPGLYVRGGRVVVVR